METPLNFSQYRREIHQSSKKYVFKALEISAIFEDLTHNYSLKTKYEERFSINVSDFEDMDSDSREIKLREIAIFYLNKKFNNIYNTTKDRKNCFWHISTTIGFHTNDYGFDSKTNSVVVLCSIFKGKIEIPVFLNDFNLKTIFYIVVIDNKFLIPHTKENTIIGIKNLLPLLKGNFEFDAINFSVDFDCKNNYYLTSSKDIELVNDEFVYVKTNEKILYYGDGKYYQFTNRKNGFKSFPTLNYQIINVWGDFHFKSSICEFIFFPYHTVEYPLKNLDNLFIYYLDKPTNEELEKTYIFIYKSQYGASHYRWVHLPNGEWDYLDLPDYDFLKETYLKYIPKNAINKEYLVDDGTLSYQSLTLISEHKEGNLFKFKKGLDFLTIDPNKIYELFSANSNLKSFRFLLLLNILKTENKNFDKKIAIDNLKKLSLEGDYSAKLFLKNWKDCSDLESVLDSDLLLELNSNK